ncbi:MAG: uroporphyrinogen decarboxylase family protein [Clostridia bacterium]|nr:uroporphyrinogen decarboxylase family protein [Clostridia bacterium]
MNVKKLLWQAASASSRRALPILSFPAAKRLGITVEEMVKSAEHQAAAMTLIATETDTPAAISPMDLSVEAEAFGAAVRFFPDEVPAVTGRLITCAAEADGLAVPSLAAGRIPLYIEGVALAKAQIKDKPVLAGMIGPYSLAGRLMDVTEIIYSCFDEPETVHTVLKKVTAFLISYGQAMKKAGADGVMMAEPLAGLLGADMAEEFSHRYVKEIVSTLQEEGFSVIYHNCGNSVGGMLDSVFALGADAYHFGNALNMETVLKSAPADALCMGNVDPVAKLANGTPETVNEAVRDLIDRLGSYQNFVLSSGCDIPAHAPWENLQAFFSAVS